MAAPVSDSPEEARIADTLKRLIRERGYTHESFANEIGVSAGRVSQWATNRGGVPPERATAVARLLELKPEEVSLGWRALRDEFLTSQGSRLDRDIILAAVRLASGAVTGVGMDRFEIETPEDAELFALAIESVLESQDAPATDSDVQRFARKLESRKGVGDGQGRSDGRAGGTASKAKAGPAAGSKTGRVKRAG